MENDQEVIAETLCLFTMCVPVLVYVCVYGECSYAWGLEEHGKCLL